MRNWIIISILILTFVLTGIIFFRWQGALEGEVSGYELLDKANN